MTKPLAQSENSCITASLRIALAGYRSHPHVGGQGIYLRHLASALSDLGHQVTVISGPPYPELTANVQLVKLPSLNLYEEPNHITALKVKYLFSFVDFYEWWSMLTGGFAEPYCFGLRLKKYLSKHASNFDLLHDNQSLCSNLLTLPIPVLATIHHPITRDRDQAIAAAVDKLQRWGAMRWYSFLTMQTKVAQRLDHVVTVSEFSRQDIETCFQRPASKTKVIFNGIDTSRFKPLPQIAKDAESLITTCSSDQPVKGFRFLLEAYAKLLTTHPNLKLRVIGKLKDDGSNSKLLKNLGLENKVKFEQGLTEDQLVEAYNRATLYICPSLYEGFGLPVAEAMSCGTAVITTDGGALPEVVGDSGILTPAGDSKALADAISALLNKPQRRQQFEQMGRRRALDIFCWHSVATQYTDLYRSIISGSANPNLTAKPLIAPPAAACEMPKAN